MARRLPDDDDWNLACDAIRNTARRPGYRVEADWLEHGAIAAVAEVAGVTRAYVSLVWGGRRRASTGFLRRLD